jgi:DNA-binding LacI/PurR family transcriptional regulator
MIEEVARITHRAGIRSTRPASHGRRTRRSAARTESGCLHDLIPNATVFVLLVNPNNPSAEILSKQAEEAARAIGVQLVVLRAGSEAELDEVFASLTGQRIGGLIVSTDPLIYDQRDRIIASAAMIEIVSGDADLSSPCASTAGEAASGVSTKV